MSIAQTPAVMLQQRAFHWSMLTKAHLTTEGHVCMKETSIHQTWVPSGDVTFGRLGVLRSQVSVHAGKLCLQPFPCMTGTCRGAAHVCLMCICVWLCRHASLEQRPHFPEILLRLRGIYKELRMAAG